MSEAITAKTSDDLEFLALRSVVDGENKVVGVLAIEELVRRLTAAEARAAGLTAAAQHLEKGGS